MLKRLKLIILLLLTATVLPAWSQSDSVRVSLITYYPGHEIYELFGHTELRVVDGFSDNFYNYGMFDFNTPNFAYRFVSGKTDYMCVAVPASEAFYQEQGRKMVEQVLNLTQPQARAVRDFLANNALPQNATYRYKFVSDNCATRPRDIIENALGKTLQYKEQGNKETFRDIMRYYNRNYPWEQFGIDLALGCGLDTTVTYRQRMFVPMLLHDAMAGATVVVNGKRQPVVSTTTVVVPGSDDGLAAGPTPWYLTPLTWSLLLLALTIFLTWRDIRRGKVTRWFDSVIYAAYALAGCVVFFLILVSTHESTSPNLNGFWLHPFYFLPAVLVWIKSAKKLLLYCHFLNFAVIILLMLSWYWLPQSANLAFFPLMAVSALRSFNYIAINNKCEKVSK